MCVLNCVYCVYHRLCFLYCIVWAILYTASIGCYVSELCTVDVILVVYLHYCQHSVPYVLVLYCIFTTASTVCCACEPCNVLHYYQCCELCDDYDKSPFVVFVQCTTNAVCHVGAMIYPLIIFILPFFIIFTHSH